MLKNEISNNIMGIVFPEDKNIYFEIKLFNKDIYETIAFCDCPIKIYLYDGNIIKCYSLSYTFLKNMDNIITAEADFRCDKCNRVIFKIIDKFFQNKYGIIIERKIRVENESDVYRGFWSGFEVKLYWDYPSLKFFAPGVWYHRNEFVPENSMGSTQKRSKPSNTLLDGITIAHNMIREDRLALPLFMVFNISKKQAFGFLRLNAKGDTVERDDTEDILIDENLRFGSIGEKHYDNDTLWVSFWYPGTEGDISYPPIWVLPITCNKQSESCVNPFEAKSNIDSNKNKWSYRFHPIRRDIEHEYRILITAWSGLSYYESLKQMWRIGVEMYEPKVFYVNLEKVKNVSISLLNKLVVKKASSKFNSVITGIPTWIDCFTGKIGKYQHTFAIGFVGRNIEVGYLLLRLGIEKGERIFITNGIDIINFWTKYSGLGLSHTDFDFLLDEWVDAGKTEEGELKVFLRQVTEGHHACLKAWKLEKNRDYIHSNWFDWILSFAEWLIRNQNKDGSFYRLYAISGKPVDDATNDCAYVVPFLLEFSEVTGNKIYKEAAISVGEYLYNNFHNEGHYFGGTLDNPNCYDKEACILAFEAYFYLYKFTGDKKWLKAAEQAATFAETWIYMWNIPMPLDDRNRFYPSDWTTIGLQIITTGCSAVDMYLSRYAYLYYELGCLTNDEHYKKIAEILHYNTKGTVQLGGSPEDEKYYGFALPGFQIEHWGMGRGRGYGLNSGWLPWVSVNHLIDILEWKSKKD